MWNLIKMEFYRLFTSKIMKIAILVACLVCAGYIFAIFGLFWLVDFALETDPEVAAELYGLLPQAAWIEGVNFAEIVFGASGVFALFVGCIVTSNFIGSEQACGYTKNFAGQIPDKGYIAVSKFVVTSLSQILILVIYTAVSSLLAVTVLGKYINGYDWGILFAALGLRLLLHLAINAIIIFICTLTKSHAISMVFGCVFGLGLMTIAYSIIQMIFGALKVNFPIGDYLPDGINNQLALGNVEELVIKAVVVSLVCMAIFVVSNYILIRKRDVR